MQIDAATAREDMRKYGALRLHYDKFGTGIKIGTVRLPNFKENNEMYSKIEPTRSDEEILEAMKELAKKHAENGTFQNIDNEYLDLFKEYVSSVSPDRESILTNSLFQIFGKINQNKENPIDINQNILQQTLKIMEEMNIKDKTTKEALLQILKNMDSKSSGAMYGKLSIIDDNKLSYVEFYNSNGEMIATYNNTTGWDGFLTKEEKVRHDEILAVYNEAFNSVYNAQNVGQSKSLVSGNSFDVVG